MAKDGATKLVADNRRARHDYTLLERFEAGLQLAGTEVKSLRQGGVTLAQAHAEERGGELWLVGAHIAPYDKSGASGHDPDRDRKLLLHRREIDRLAGRVRERGLTLVPTRLYFKNGRAKVEIALAKGKDVGDKRRAIKEREMKREMDRAIRR
jgi:SsrA-binding protein